MTGPETGQIRPEEEGVVSPAPLHGGELTADTRVLGCERVGLCDERLLLLAGRGELALLPVPLARKRVLARQQLVLHAALLLRAHRNHLCLRMDARTNRLRALARDMHLVACGLHLRRDAFVLPRNRVEVVELVERILERARFENHLDERGVTRLVDVDHPQVELA